MAPHFETVSPRFSSVPFDLRQFLGDQANISRLITHIIVISLAIALVTIGGFRRLTSRQLRAPQYVPPEIVRAGAGSMVDNGQPLTLPEQLNNQNRPLFPLAIPQTILPEGGAAGERVEESVTITLNEVQSYIVQPGDTVFDIALKFGLAPETILWANPILEDNPDLLRLNQELTILPINGVYHQVKAGDTISGLATTYKIDSQIIIDYPLNELDTANPVIYTGQWLIVPDGIKPYVPKIVSSASVNAPAGVLGGTGNFQWPADGRVTQDFWSGHRAVDIGAWHGAPIYAADSGYVVVSQWDDTGYGRMLVVDHGNGFKTLYAHISVYYVSVGDEVKKGQQIAIMGSTGNSTGPHLHFEVLLNGVKRNPWGFLP